MTRSLSCAEVEKRAAANPQDAATNVRYLKLLMEEGQLEQSAEFAARLPALEPAAPLAAEAGRALLDAGQFAAAKPLIEYAAKSTPSPSVNVDLAMAMLHTEGAQALSQLDRIPEAQRSGDYYLERAQVLDAAGHLDEALAAIEKARDAAPSRPQLYNQAADFLVRHGRPAEAVQLLDRGARTHCPITGTSCFCKLRCSHLPGRQTTPSEPSRTLKTAGRNGPRDM